MVTAGTLSAPKTPTLPLAERAAARYPARKDDSWVLNNTGRRLGGAVFGVIQQPVTGALWHGVPGGGAFRRTEGGDLALRTRVPAARPLRVAASRSHRDARTQALLDALPAHETLACGSSLKFCRIAEGEIDLYPRFGPTSEWDTAAGQAILEAAGGAVLDPRGRPFRYNQREGLLNGDFVALGDPALRAGLPA